MSFSIRSADDIATLGGEGIAGPTGPTGYGSSGSTGYTGYTGYTGLTGYTGYTGYTGCTGYTGDSGGYGCIVSIQETKCFASTSYIDTYLLSENYIGYDVFKKDAIFEAFYSGSITELSVPPDDDSALLNAVKTSFDISIIFNQDTSKSFGETRVDDEQNVGLHYFEYRCVFRVIDQSPTSLIIAWNSTTITTGNTVTKIKQAYNIKQTFAVNKLGNGYNINFNIFNIISSPTTVSINRTISYIRVIS